MQQHMGLALGSSGEMEQDVLGGRYSVHHMGTGGTSFGDVTVPTTGGQMWQGCEHLQVDIIVSTPRGQDLYLWGSLPTALPLCNRRNSLVNTPVSPSCLNFGLCWTSESLLIKVDAETSNL